MEKWIKKNDGKTIAEIVKKRTKMTVEELINDKKYYHYGNLFDATALFHKHIKAKSKILFFGDYDTDGQCANIINNIGINALRCNAKVVTPHRFSDGYGIKERHIEEFEDYNLLILCDNGIAANEAVAKAKELGIDVIILDHHQPRVDENGTIMLPNADVIVDPHITNADFKDLCGAGITYLFWCEFMDNFCSWMSDKQIQFLKNKMSCFAAIGTVGDVVSLTGHNRKLVKEGLKQINLFHGTAGLKLLMKNSFIENMSSTDIAFTISPIINASGRLYDEGPDSTVRLLSYDTYDDRQMLDLCKTVIETNKNRKEISAASLERVEKIIQGSNMANDNFLVIVDPQVSLGIAGLVSGKLTEKYNRPSIVLTKISDGVYKGSGRSIEGTDIKKILDKTNNLIAAYGGHPQACGITVLEENLDVFRKAVNDITPEWKPAKLPYYDLEIMEKDLLQVLAEKNRFEPYGQGNPDIRFLIKGIKINADIKMGQNKEHIKLISKNLDVLWFFKAKEYEEMGSPAVIDAIGTLSVQKFKGESKIVLQAVEVDISK